MLQADGDRSVMNIASPRLNDTRAWLPVVLWVALLAACVIVIGRATFTADLSAFLPRAPTAEQQVLVDQLTEGAVSRLILIGIEAPDAATRARLSRATGAACGAPEFTLVSNGELVGGERDRIPVQPSLCVESRGTAGSLFRSRVCAPRSARASISSPRRRG